MGVDDIIQTVHLSGRHDETPRCSTVRIQMDIFCLTSFQAERTNLAQGFSLKYQLSYKGTPSLSPPIMLISSSIVFLDSTAWFRIQNDPYLSRFRRF